MRFSITITASLLIVALRDVPGSTALLRNICLKTIRNIWNGIRKWAERIGINTYTAVNAILASKSVEQQTYRSCMGLLKLAKRYSEAMLEAACKRALSYTSSPSYKSIKNIIVTGSVKRESVTTDSVTTSKAHGITRGADYYRR